MAKTIITRVTRSHVSGFVKKFRYNRMHKTITFVIAKQSFVIPSRTTFGALIRVANISKQNVLVIFDDSGRTHPKVLGVIGAPLWSQVSAASQGLDFEAVKAIYPKDRMFEQ